MYPIYLLLVREDYCNCQSLNEHDRRFRFSDGTPLYATASKSLKILTADLSLCVAY